MKVKVKASNLTTGTILASGEVVIQVLPFNFGNEVMIVTSEQTFEAWAYQGIPINQETNCLYGGNASGHSINCTAKGCW